jgi:hypothetical protein
MIVVEPDSASFYVFNRSNGDAVLNFSIHHDTLTDSNTNSKWNWKGRCIDGELTGTTLPIMQAYQEYWHSWSMFRGKDAYHGK